VATFICVVHAVETFLATEWQTIVSVRLLRTVKTYV